MRTEIITDITKAKEIWEILSPGKSIYDTWLLRSLYYDIFNFPLAFHTMFDGDTPVALLPLQYNKDKGYAEFFGGNYMEDNKIFVKEGYGKNVSEFIENIEQPFKLEKMSQEIPNFSNEVSTYKYELSLDGIADIEEYLLKFWNSKPRKNVKAQMKKIKDQHVEITYNNYKDFEDMVELNRKRFGEQSSLNQTHRQIFLKKLMNYFDVKMISIRINGKLESVGYSLLYEGTYIGFNSGTNHEINGLGKFLALQKIEQAITLSAKKYDARVDEMGWKDAFGFTPRPQYSFIKN